MWRRATSRRRFPVNREEEKEEEEVEEEKNEEDEEEEEVEEEEEDEIHNYNAIFCGNATKLYL